MLKEVSMVKLVWETLDAAYTSQKCSDVTDSEKSPVKNVLNVIQSSVVNHNTLFFSKMHRSAMDQNFLQTLAGKCWSMKVG